MKKINREQYWDKRSLTYEQETDEVFGEANKKIVTAIKKFCSSDDSVLDIGCGPGIITRDVAETVSKIRAIDISPDMIKEAKKNNLPNVSWEVNELTQMEIQEDYTFATACNVLLYMENVDFIVKKVYDILPKGGYFAAVIDCLGESKNIYYYLRVMKLALGKRPYNKNYSINEFRDLFISHGFEIVYEENVFKPTNNYIIIARK